ncbi:phosphoribosylanthranilate isomerase [Ketobacter sp.]|uniref:phosphoribosylanthranilate isomerase n=1 Tax=Ketobacter sp. TaxID=2083498 RepID=UPI0025BEFB41|nr:phosphoribosylanthranilate isomerase [Ketobacter sp.]
MTRVKICGITNLPDALAAAAAGADALGFVFYEPSPRCVNIDAAKTILAELPPFVTTVGLFVNAEQAFLESVLGRLPLDLLQFHGDETEAECRQWGRPYIKALRMQEGLDLVEQCQTYHSSRGILLDAFVAGKPGGTGQVFDWNTIPPGLEKPIVLAGGLDPSNVGAAVKQVRPWAVDVSGGVEAAKGVKDHALIKAFITGVHSVSE